jgi:hypothetical protein
MLGNGQSRSKTVLAVAVLLAGAIAIMYWQYQPKSRQDIDLQSLETPQQQVPGKKFVSRSPGRATRGALPGSRPVPTIENDATLAISGSVLNQQGQRLVDIQLTATASQTADPFIGDGEHSTSSDASGRFRFGGLALGDYLIRNEETSLYPGTSINVRSGSSEANLVLTARSELWVHGSVREGDEPLPGVSVVPGGDPMNITYSGADGRFGIFVGLRGGNQGQDTLLFSLQGYSAEELPLRIIDPFATDLPLADVRLTRIRGRAAVRGNITADDSPVSGASVRLVSTEHSDGYQTSSGDGGRFEIPNVIFGEYSLAVARAGNYKDHNASGLQVTAAGLDLQLNLEPLEIGQLSGQMLDINGGVLPGFDLWVTSLTAQGQVPQVISGDAQGFFELRDIPVGDRALATDSDPRMRISGVSVSGNNDAPLQLILDVGSHVLEGRVLDSFSNAVPGARVSLIWAHVENGITSHAARTSIADTSGYFRFAELGSGKHTLNVTAAGIRSRRIEHEVGVGGELQIVLQQR